MGLNCEGCQSEDAFCNCSLDKIAFENTFQVFVIMESKNHFSTQWCPQATLRSDFFNCDAEGAEKIIARLICDGGIDCPLTGADESHFVCSPQQIRLLVISIHLTIYLVALGSATFLICSKGRQPLRPAPKELTLAEKEQISDTLREITEYMKDQCIENEEKMTKSIQEMLKETQLNLIKVAHSIEVRDPNNIENIFETTVRQVLYDEAQEKKYFALIKESTMFSTSLKLDVLEVFEPKGWLKRKFQGLSMKCTEAVKITLVMMKGILSALFWLLVIPLPEIKDLITIVSIKIFHHDIIQGRAHLIDNIPLDDFVTVLSVIYGFIFILKLIEAHSSSVSSASWHHWIPFVTDIEIALKKIQEIIERYKSKLNMQSIIDDDLDDSEQATSKWKKIVDIAQEIEEVDINTEVLGAKRREIRVISCLGDILQGCVLMLLLLRTDLRIRSIFQFASVCHQIGLDPRQGGRAGKSFL